MRDPLSFYQQEKLKFEERSDQLQLIIKRFSFFRLSVFLIVLVTAYLNIKNTVAFVAIIVLGLIVFVILVIKHQSLKATRNLFKELININHIEINALKGQYDSLYDGTEYIDAHHYYSNDIDLFGKGSFFQYLNRTATLSGRQTLVSWLLANNPDHIEPRQVAIKELSQKPAWRQRFLALAKLIKTEMDDRLIITWIQDYRSFLPAFMNYLPIVFSILSIAFILLTSIGLFSIYLVLIWFFVGLAINIPFAQKIGTLYSFAGRTKETFKQYHVLLKEIETVSLEAGLLKEEQKKIRSSRKKASLIFNEFSRILDAFDQRNNLLFGFLGNGFFLWDIQQTARIDRWVKNYQLQVGNWFEVIAYFDAQISLANYTFNHPDHHFPSISEKEEIIVAKSMGHPLIEKEHRVCNDLVIKKKEFHIITGANMAGKSTFLRTVSLGLVMANSGLPVCADKMIYNPIKLISSMRTSDSLADESSYFYAEIMRLRFIVEQMENDDCFIILDEILKGTNSRDKAEGSWKFVERLVKSGSTGIIATHDLSLCDIAKKYPQIHNKYFDAQIKDEELFFDYQLREGVCTNMNASFLLKKMDII